RLRSYTIPPNLKELEKELEEVKKEKDSAVLSQEFEKAASYRDQEQKLREKLETTKNKWKEERSEEHTSELQSRFDLVCRLLLEKKNKKEKDAHPTNHKK